MSISVRQIARRSAWVLLILVLLGIVAWTGFNVLSASRYEAALRSLEEAGFATSLTALAPPGIPTRENAAPFYSAAFALHVKPPNDPEGDLDWTPDPRGVISAMSEGDRAKLKAWLESNQDAFDMVARGRKRSRGRFERDYSQGFSMLLPEMSEIIALSRALEARAYFQSLEGDAAAAQDSVRSILALGDSLREEPILVEQLVRFVTVRLAMTAIDACVSATTPEDELRSWSALLPGEKFLDGALDRGFRGEMGMAINAVSGPQGEFWNQAVIPVWLGGPLVRSDAARYLGVMRQAVEACAKPYAAARVDLDRLEGLHHRRLAWSRPVCGALLPALATSLETVTKARAHVAVIRAGLEAEGERRRSGRYPEKIEVRDPFTGQPLEFNRVAGMIRSEVPAGHSDRIEWLLRSAGK